MNNNPKVLTLSEYLELSRSLKQIVDSNIIPTNWGGKIQNDDTDKFDVTDYETYGALNNAITIYSQEDQIYIIRRWYMYQCSLCDEYLFYQLPNVLRNPNSYSKDWDICIYAKSLYGTINQKYFYDIKSTRIFYELKDYAKDLIDHPAPLVYKFYEDQSTDKRESYQDRLFIVHHSFVEYEREVVLRSEWGLKELVYKYFSDNINFVSKFPYELLRNNVNYSVCGVLIFIIEEEIGKIKVVIPGLAPQEYKRISNFKYELVEDKNKDKLK